MPVIGSPMLTLVEVFSLSGPNVALLQVLVPSDVVRKICAVGISLQ